MSKIFMHVDGDAFFASCEQATQMGLRGKPVAVGAERGIVTAFSYEAKALGVTRGVSGAVLRKQFPQVELLSSDYRKYEFFSARMKNIVRRYVDMITDASIDECYADITDVTNWDDVHTFAAALQDELCTKLGLTVSIGIGPTMTIAKICSGLKKPRGLTIVKPETLEVLHDVPLRKVPGVGGRTEALLSSHDIITIGDLVALEPNEVARRYAKPLVELFYELRGTPLRAIVEREHAQSVSSIHAVTEPILALPSLLTEFSRNVERVCRKLRAQDSRMSAVTIGYKAFPDVHALITRTITFTAPTHDPGIVMQHVEETMRAMYRKGIRYRATYISSHGTLTSTTQQKLFTTKEDEAHDSRDTINAVVDTLMFRHGGTPLLRASSIRTQEKEGTSSGTPLLKISHTKKVLDIPYLGSIS